MPIRPRGKKWQVDVLLPSGERFRRSRDTEAQARAMEGEVAVAIENGYLDKFLAAEKREAVMKEAAPTIEEIIPMVDKAHNAEEWSEGWRKTALGYLRDAATLLKEMGIVRVDELDRATITRLDEKWSDRGNSGATINRKHAALASLFKVAVDRGHLDVEHIPAMRKRAESLPRNRVYSQIEEHLIIETLRKMEHNTTADLMVMLFESGLRLGTALSTKWEQVLDEKGNVVEEIMYPKEVMKAKNDHWVLVTDRMRTVLAERAKVRNETERVFQISPYTVECHWQELRKRLGKEGSEDYVIHAIRHTFISRIAQVDQVNPAALMQLAGHKCLATTMRYIHKDRKEGQRLVRQQIERKVANG